MTTGFTCGAFDLLHPGHLAMLRECKEYCDYLVVGLQSDPTIDRPTKNKPIQSIFERWQQLDAIKFVDQIVPYDTEKDLENLFAVLPIDVRFIGMDHINDIPTAQEICKQKNIKIIYNTRFHSYSSSELRNRMEKINVTTCTTTTL